MVHRDFDLCEETLWSSGVIYTRLGIVGHVALLVDDGLRCMS